MGEDASYIDPDLGVILALLRTGRGWSQAELARVSGVPASSVSQYETGKKLPELKSLMRMLSSMEYGFSDLDRARDFLLALRFSRGSAGARQRVDTVPPEVSDALSEQIASMTAQAGEAVSRLTGAIALLVRHRSSASSCQKSGPMNAAGSGVTMLSPENSSHAAGLWERLQRYPFSFQEALVREAREFQSWALCEHLCLESKQQASNNPALAVQLGKLAVQVAELVPVEDRSRYKLRGYASALLANALRAQGDLKSAEEKFVEAEELWRSGEGCTVNLLESRLLDLKASLRRSQRRFPEALELLDRALVADERGFYTGHLLIKRAKTLEEMGELETAIVVLKEAEPFIESEKDPRLFLCLKHNLADYLSKTQRYTEAESLLSEVNAICYQLGSELDRIRLRWVEGRISNGLGRTDQGIEILARVRGEFASRGMHYDTALVSLELATILAREGRTDQVKALARHMTPIFQAQGVHREALAALALFRQAAENEKVTADLARRLLEYLHRARHDPKLRFET